MSGGRACCIRHKLLPTLWESEMSAFAKPCRSVACGIAGLLVAAWLALPAAAAEAPADKVPADVFTTASIARWADATFAKIVAEHRVSGLGFTVVDPNKVIFIKGYGYEDVATQK